MRPIWVLLWRHGKMRLRSVLSYLEYLLPMSVFLLFALLLLSAKSNKSKDSKTISYADLMSSNKGSILYTPGTNFTNRLMDEVGRRLRLKRLDHLPNKKELGYYLFTNESSHSMIQYSKDTMGWEDAIVIFENIDSEIMPKKLNYTIRMRTEVTFDRLDTPKKETNGDVRIPRNMFKLLYHKTNDLKDEAFMRLQWAIDNSYIRLRTGNDVKQNLTLQPLQSTNTNDDMLETTEAGIMIFLYMTAPLMFNISVAFWVSRLFEEKNKGLHELQKSAGLRGDTIALSHVLSYVPAVVLFVVSGVTFFGSFSLLQTNPGHFIIPFLQYPFTLIAFAYFLLYLFNIQSAQYGQTLVFGILMLLWILTLAVILIRARPLALLLMLLLIHVPFTHFCTMVFVLELHKIGLSTSTMWLGDISVGDTYVFSILQTLLYSMLAWYLSKVRPGNHGQPLPWNFVFTKTYWYKQEQREIPPDQFANEDENKYFEKAPANVPVSIQVINVYKAFNEEPVLLGVNLAVYHGEITALLGHNGAGKTTLINIITGLMRASSGRVLVEGHDNAQKSVEARKLIGFCPQHDIFFTKFTVIEHVMFFAMLKGQSYSEAKNTSAQLLAKLQFAEKAEEIPNNLSGGQKRRAQLACAVAGGARVLVLDEPTSGLDVESRRELWDLLLSLRGEHTLLMTTHFMEEADALGDRIVALHRGRVRCHATGMFLKRAIGTGYRLTLTTFGPPMEPAITKAVTAVVPDTTIRDRRPTGVSYNLPAKDTERFPQLFASIEDARLELQIDTIGVGKSTLDDVFLVLCRDEQDTLEEDSSVPEVPALEKVTGAKLYRRQFAALLLRQWRYMNVTVYVIMMIIICLLILLACILANGSKSDDISQEPDEAPTMNLDLYGEQTKTHALVNVDNGTLATLRKSFSEVQFDLVPDVDKAALRNSEEAQRDVRNCLVGIEINDSSAKAHYSPSLRHAAPVALNALSNALAARALGASSGADARVLTARSSPLRGAYVPYESLDYLLPKESDTIDTWVRMMMYTMCIYLASLSGLPCAERLSGARHAHVMAGAPRVLHWAATLLVHVLRTLPIIVIITICPRFMEQDETLDQTGFIQSMAAVLLLGMFAVLGFVYTCSSLFSQIVSMAVLMIVIFVSVVAAAGTIKYFASPKQLFNPLFLVLPPYTFTIALKRAAYMAQLNAYCNLNRIMCPELIIPGGFSSESCCDTEEGTEPWSYFMFFLGAGMAMLVLAIQTVVYFTVAYLLDDGAFDRCCATSGRRLLCFADPAVMAEAAYAEKTIKLPNDQIPDSVLCYKVQKNFSASNTDKPFVGVKSISFSVKKGECFGLLGVNGAGKSTTFKMLTGGMASSGGEIFANGYRVAQRRCYMTTLSYCPQFGGIDNFLTGRQNLILLLTLRGLTSADAAAVAASWIKEVDIGKHADKRLTSYSGGNARRLTAAVALCQGARTAVLDEPTAGVDPVARRLMHRAITRAKRHCSIIIASHSMDEIEALCHRIAIMSRGELRALGTAPALKTQHAQGFSVVFKLASENVKEDDLNTFREQLHERLQCEQKDHFRSILRYHINGPLRYSELFTRLENLREQFPVLVEDYTVTETTLEEVFLALAKEAREQAPSSV